MPLYYGHQNNKGLSVSPLLQIKKINLLRASPHDVRVVAWPLVKQPGYQSYVSYLPAFIKAQIEQKNIPLLQSGYVTNYPADKVIPVAHPSLVVDYSGPVPSKNIETFNDIGFERIKIKGTDNILHFPIVNLSEVRKIRETNPRTVTPAPNNAVNLSAFDSWVTTLRLISGLLSTHIYPAFRDQEHYQDDIDALVYDITLKRKAKGDGKRTSKRQKGDGDAEMEDVEEDETDEDDDGVPLEERAVDTVELSRAKPQKSIERGWGTPGDIPNASGIFFPFVSELSSYDTQTVPELIEHFLFQSLGVTAERQVERMDRLRSDWGLIGKTDAGVVLSHIGKTISLALRSQARCYPVFGEGNVYEGSVLSGARFFVGMHGQVYRPLSYEKLQSEIGDFSTHTKSLEEIMTLAELSIDEKASVTTMRKLRSVLLKKRIGEDDRDKIRKLAVHLHFKEKFLAVNATTITKIISELLDSAYEDEDLPMHHSVLFSTDKVLHLLSAFGYQAPSFVIDNCPKVPLSGKPPTTFVMRQKPLDIAVQDWKSIMDSKEIRNNPKNLSRANRDRSLVGNDKNQIWSELVKLGGTEKSGDVMVEPGFVVDTGKDGLDDW